MEKITTPKHLQAEGRTFWESVLNDYDLEESHHLKLLENASVCVDRIAQARRKIRKDGGFYKDRWGIPKEHPAQKSERENKILFARLVRELQLDIETPAENRPPQL